MAQQTKVDNVVVTLSIKVLFEHDALLLEPKSFMKLYRALVVCQRLAADFMQF
jgi:hypothetical protein